MTHVTRDDVVYQLASTATRSFAARLSGLFVSDDGDTWRSAYDSLRLTAPLATLSVLVAESGRRPWVFAGCNGGLLRSGDGGTTWESCALPEPAPAVVALTASPQFEKDGRLFAATLQDGVLYSHDHGAHWRTGNIGLIDMNVLCLTVSPGFANDQVVYAGTQTGLFRSHNAGRSWREAPLPIGFEAVLSLAITAEPDSALYVGTEGHGLWRSADRGATWSAIGGATLSGSINQVQPLTGSSHGPQMMVVHDGRALVSRDDGRTWRPFQPEQLKRVTVTAIGAAPGDRIVVGLDDGRTLTVPDANDRQDT